MNTAYTYKHQEGVSQQSDTPSCDRVRTALQGKAMSKMMNYSAVNTCLP
ncbi:hypothetical protein EVA_04953 [gut metagenome]|uniref:Uncharacterized protein n=1 Tax=gut metagenome TaxID=749906 RepID=J9GVJ9_9ZZZZ